ncbi:hypothetical protein AOXY_G23352 [Acipenser oxyrinchus oxyrinchus]|uniref:Immunoglobulin V-set domain-containing protein n=1 Tax=Acipenser oxyrinchus oxyrinchus TaxID=40147 RepID=A0AAD8FYF6_ACIOX|nr:hypothetical protein AOXY_G23352 [Acipenser oxyrinchus oxyrinchus]
MEFRVNGVLLLAVLMLGCFCSVSASEFVKVPSSVNCTVGQDCILNCSFNVTAGGGWDDKSNMFCRKTETNCDVHGYQGNSGWLSGQHPRYVNRTSLFHAELLQRGDASLLLRRVTEKDAGKYHCDVYAPKQSGWGLIELVLVPAEPTTPPVPAEPAAPAVLEGQHHWFIVVPVVLCVIAGLCVGLKLAVCCWKPNNALTASYSLT